MIDLKLICFLAGGNHFNMMNIAHMNMRRLTHMERFIGRLEMLSLMIEYGIVFDQITWWVKKCATNWLHINGFQCETKIK